MGRHRGEMHWKFYHANGVFELLWDRIRNTVDQFFSHPTAHKGRVVLSLIVLYNIAANQTKALWVEINQPS